MIDCRKEHLRKSGLQAQPWYAQLFWVCISCIFHLAGSVLRRAEGMFTSLGCGTGLRLMILNCAYAGRYLGGLYRAVCVARQRFSRKLCGRCRPSYVLALYRKFSCIFVGAAGEFPFQLLASPCCFPLTCLPLPVDFSRYVVIGLQMCFESSCRQFIGIIVAHTFLLA